MLMQDNHSFDNYFGTYPGADGIPAGVCQRLELTRSTTSGCVKPFRLGTTTPRTWARASASRNVSTTAAGWTGSSRRTAGSGSTARPRWATTTAATSRTPGTSPSSTSCSTGSSAPTAVGSRESYLYWVAAERTGEPRTPLTSSAGYDQLPTIFDRLAAKGISAKFYVENLGSRTLGPGAAGPSAPASSSRCPCSA